MSDRPIALLIDDIWDSIARIQRYTTGFDQESFSGDSRTVDAVVRNLEVIGEAASRLPEEFRGQQPSVDWRQIIGLRNRIIHGYFSVDLRIIWQILQHDLPRFKESLNRIRQELDAAG